MNIKQLFNDEDAVSPVIGVILMVAITVILAAVIGTFVLGLGDQVDSSAPSANFQFAYQDVDDADTDDEVVITHNGGQDIDSSRVEVQGATALAGTAGAGDEQAGWTNDPISTGTQWDGDIDVSPGETIRVVWSSANGGSSNTIGESTVPS